MGRRPRDGNTRDTPDRDDERVDRRLDPPPLVGRAWARHGTLRKFSVAYTVRPPPRDVGYRRASSLQQQTPATRWTAQNIARTTAETVARTDRGSFRTDGRSEAVSSALDWRRWDNPTNSRLDRPTRARAGWCVESRAAVRGGRSPGMLAGQHRADVSAPADHDRKRSRASDDGGPGRRSERVRRPRHRPALAIPRRREREHHQRRAHGRRARHRAQ